MRRPALISASAAVALAALVVGIWTVVRNGDETALATEADNPPSTTTTVTSTTVTPSTTTAEPSTTTTTVAAVVAAAVPTTAPAIEAWQVSDSLYVTTTTTTTTTAAPTTAAPSTGGGSGPAPVTISKPSCATNLGGSTTRTAPFTGLQASIPSNMPAVVVKVSNNSSKSRAALIGLDQADIVFEERIEASATRFFAVFHSSLPANVGPVRSGRTTDIQITQNLNRPVFGYSGSNSGVARQIKFAADNGILVPYINTDRAPFARDSRYRSPDNLFVDPAALGACGGGGQPTAVFSYGGNSGASQPASSVSLSARSSYRFDWNGSAWVRSQSGYAHTTRTGAALAPKNVVVLFVPYVQSQIDSASVDAETIGSGAAWVFRDGTATIGNWRRNKGHEPYTLTDANGTKVNLAPGQTWVVLAPAGTASWN